VSSGSWLSWAPPRVARWLCPTFSVGLSLCSRGSPTVMVPFRAPVPHHCHGSTLVSWAAISKYPKRSLKQQAFISQFWRLKFKIKGWLSPWLVDGHRIPTSLRCQHSELTCPCHLLFLQGRQSDWIRIPPAWPHFNLITSVKTLFSNPVTFKGRGPQHISLEEGDDTVQPITGPLHLLLSTLS
jgi:hypothetical protein